ncbi:Eco57I restriction-modification methylase domain-containing protein [Bacillus atrophaeus]|uniref:Eco57I restriction-modification methylase domain-containing protein n=2 Tax=Bacillus atrophaeus TaxID=1452 RepID=UPI00228214C3|nr:N-6 DNA methylase [Bacillus atrophaeus]MCY8826059.1 N-6 DNA methylase [Bacillus atrophaeus]MCY8840432.1 N-6 DNA methylase [Bacillus atrophaeus]MEC0857425.1 N-6 DNA methylase [Bacillus atrophaeus]MEC0860888.1 N-6 DNA methylase [Bacillus atrophaeus]MEC0869832.1 N-6 DNA methylase [Bacillus atrophaeus]
MMKNATMIKETGSHYTSGELSKFMARKLLEQVELNNSKEDYQTVLDPSCGDGELLKAFFQESNNQNLEVIGMDTNSEAVDSAHQHLNADDNENIHLFNGDYLKLFTESNPDLFSEVLVREDYWSSDTEEDGLKKVDMIIANPPYVRTQVLGGEKSQDLGKKFNLKGKVDLYHVFFVAMTQHLKENGLICAITSNRYLTTAGGKDIRKFLDENYEIIEVIDLGDTKLFDAAVLPAIFIGRKKSNKDEKKNEKVKFYRIYENSSLEDTEKCDSIFEILLKKDSGSYETNGKKYEVTVGYLKIPEDSKELWVMASKEDNLWSEIVKSQAKCKFEDVFNVRVGIKTTADSVFIRDDWDKLDDSMIPESELLKPLVSSDTVNKWVLPQLDNTKILYTHEVVNGKRKAIDIEQYPKAKAYLESHRERLEGRSYIIKAKRNWYEIWVPQDPSKWLLPKVVFPDISSEPKFAVDTNEYLVDGNCYWLSLKDKESTDLLYLAVAVANSGFMSKFHEIEFQNKLYAGRKRYLTQYVKNYPLPDPTSTYSQRIIEIVKEITHNNLSEEEIKQYETEIETEVTQAFGF